MPPLHQNTTIQRYFIWPTSTAQYNDTSYSQLLQHNTMIHHIANFYSTMHWCFISAHLQHNNSMLHIDHNTWTAMLYIAYLYSTITIQHCPLLHHNKSILQISLKKSDLRMYITNKWISDHILEVFNLYTNRYWTNKFNYVKK